MEMSISDVADRFTILLQKFIHGKRDDTMSAVKVELRDCLTSLSRNPGFARLLVDLLEANVEIWWLETDIRQGKDGTMTLEEVGRRALAIRDTNKRRIQVKNDIESYCGEDRFEVKIAHASR